MRFLLTTFTLALLAVDSAAHAALEIRNLEAAHGRYGPKREGRESYPGEEILFRYQVNGAHVDSLGRIDVVLEESVTDERGRSILHARGAQRSILALGGATFTGQAVVTFPDDAPTGSYKLTLTVTDSISGESAVAEQELTLKPVEFALVMPRFSYDEAGELPAPASGLLGQAIHVSVKAIGLDSSRNSIDADMQLQIVDKSGKATLPKPITVTFRQDDPKIARQISLVRFKAQLVLNRVGEFTLKITVTDRAAGKSATFSSPLIVTAP
jgi:hypothetical protein